MVTSKAYEKMIIAAKNAGVEKDQLIRFLEAGYVPQPKQMQFHAAARECDKRNGPQVVAMGGSRGQTKSHTIQAQVWLDDMMRVDGLKCLYLRKIQKKAGESFDDLRRKVLHRVPHKMANNILTLPNGSHSIMGGFHHENQIDAYLGIEYDLLNIEDATALTKSKRDVVFASIRSSRDDWRPRKYLSANPGGVGHQYFKQDYVDPWKRKQETSSRFIHTSLGDNVYINPEYEDFLRSLTGWLKRAWADGDFEISAGQFFTTFNEDVHVKEEILWDDSWTFWCSLDHGFNHWTVCYLFGMDKLGNIYVLDEHMQRKWPIEWHCRDIKAMITRNGLSMPRIYTFVAGTDVFAKRTTENTIAEQYADDGIELEPAEMDRISGAAKILTLLGDSERGIPSRLFISNKCQGLIECLSRMQHDPKRPDDVLKVDCDQETGEGGDDPYDGCRYGVMANIGGYGFAANPFENYRG